MKPLSSFDPNTFRSEFPAAQDDKSIYLDSASTALKPRALIDATAQFYAHGTATVHRSQHQNALSITRRFEQARQQVADLIAAPSANNIIWTKGTTEAINLVAQSYARIHLQPRDDIIVSEAEHHANLIPWLMVAEQTGARVVKLPVNTQGIPDISLLPSLLTKKSKLLALGQMSNVTGGCPDLAAAIAIAHQQGCLVMVDGAQGIVHHPVNVKNLDIDFYAFSAHKLYGPTGLGVLYGKTELLEQMSPWQGGGKMLVEASFAGFTPNIIPHRFEAGTPNVASVLSFSAVLDWLATVDMSQAEAYSVQLANSAEQALARLPGFQTFRAPDASLLSFGFSAVHHSDLITLLAEQGIAIRSGQHCAQPLMAALGVNGCLRASFAPYNQTQDVDAFVNAINYALSLLAD